MGRRTWTDRYALIRTPFCRTVSEELVEDHGAYLRAAPGLKVEVVLLGYFLQSLLILHNKTRRSYATALQYINQRIK